MNEASYRVQTQIVVMSLMEDKSISRNDALKLWYNSKTKRNIQDKYHMFWISGTRCYDELLMEMSNDPYWFMGDFE